MSLPPETAADRPEPTPAADPPAADVTAEAAAERPADRPDRAAAKPGGPPRAVLFWAALLMLLSGMMAVYAAQQWLNRQPDSVAEADVEAPVIPPGELVTEFALKERNGALVGSEDLRGQVWVANFFYSRCPGSCRQQTMLVSTLERDFREAGVKFVSITCDPKNDTPAELREYAHGFDAPEDWWFLTGDLLYIRRIGAEFFQLAVSEQGHQDRLAVVDKWGNVRGRFNWHDALQVDKLRKLLPELAAEQTPPDEAEL